MQNKPMPNEDFEPTDACDRVLDVFKQDRNQGDPWGRANPRHIINETEMEKPNVEYQIRRLNDAGWIQKIARGLYEFVEDPRETDETTHTDT